MAYLTIDIGGTSIKYACIDEKLNLYDKGSVPTICEDKEKFIMQIHDIYKQFEDIDGVCISMPGVIDMHRGYVYNSGALNCIFDTPFSDELEEMLHVPVSIINDANAATYAELRFGHLQGVKNGVAIILGTGIGGGIVVNGELVQGSHFSAGEFSVMSMDPKNEMDLYVLSIGSKGLSKEIEKSAGKKDLSGIKIFDLAEAGDQDVLQGLRNYCVNLMSLIHTVQYTLDPEVFVIGGGISKRSLLLDMLNEVNDGWKRLEGFPKPKLDVCKYYNDSNLIGAYAFHIDQTK